MLIQSVYQAPLWTDIGQFIVQIIALFGGGIGIWYTIQQVLIARKTFEFNSTPILLHLGFFKFFQEDNRPENLSYSKIKNIGNRPCFNIRGWCVVNNEFYKLIFGEVTEDNKNNKKEFRGDYKYSWAEKLSVIDFTIMKPPITRMEGTQDHIFLLYEDNEKKQYYTYLDKSYSYKVGEFKSKQIFDILKIDKDPFSKMLGYIK